MFVIASTGISWKVYRRASCLHVRVSKESARTSHLTLVLGMTVDASGVFDLELSSDEDEDAEAVETDGHERKAPGRQRSTSAGGVEMTSIAVEGGMNTADDVEGAVAVRHRSASTGTPMPLNARKKRKSKRKRSRSRSRSGSGVSGKVARGRWRAVKVTVEKSQKALKEQRTRVSDCLCRTVVSG